MQRAKKNISRKVRTKKEKIFKSNENEANSRFDIDALYFTFYIFIYMGWRKLGLAG